LVIGSPAGNGLVDRRAVVDDGRANQCHHFVRQGSAYAADNTKPAKVRQPVRQRRASGLAASYLLALAAHADRADRD
jgi:hypothetical protein